MKSVSVLIERPLDGPDRPDRPDRSGREALRMAIGLTLADNRVTVAFAGEAVRALCGPAEPELAAVLEGLERVGVRLTAEQEAVEQWGGDRPLRMGIETLDSEQMKERMTQDDIVIPFRRLDG